MAYGACPKCGCAWEQCECLIVKVIEALDDIGWDNIQMLPGGKEFIKAIIKAGILEKTNASTRR